MSPRGVLVRVGRGARRLRGFLFVALLVAVTVTAVTLRRMDNRPAGDDTVGQVVRVGVADGGSIPDYEQRTRAELARLAGAGSSAEVYALVTLREYLAPDRLPPVLGGVSLSEVYARVPAPGLQTQIVRIPAYQVPDDVSGGMDAVAKRKVSEAADYARLAADLGDGDQDRQLRAVYAAGQQVATTEANAYRQHCSCVYAAVVRAAPAALELVAARDGVRTVDAAPEVRRLDRAVFLPPLPEQHVKAGPPDDSVQVTASPSAGPR
jgi:hypothetical protein